MDKQRKVQCDLTVKWLIEKTKKFDENMEVAVQFRDDGGDYLEMMEEIIEAQMIK